MEAANRIRPNSLNETRPFQSRAAQRASVYIGYAPDDENVAGRFCALFEARGTPCWYTARDYTPEMAWPQCVVEAIENSKYFILLLTEGGSRSSDVISQVAEAYSRGRIILVIQSIAEILNPELDAMLTNSHFLVIDGLASEQDIESAWTKIIEIESNATWDEVTDDSISTQAPVEASSFLIQMECLRGRVHGKTSCQLALGDRLVFGRGPEADVHVEDERASRRHAGLFVERNRKYGVELYLMDLMSRNGTWLRYRREGDEDISHFLEYTKTRVVNGAIIRIGSTDIKVTVVPVPINSGRFDS